MPYGMMVTAAIRQCFKSLTFWHLTLGTHIAKCHAQNA